MKKATNSDKKTTEASIPPPLLLHCMLNEYLASDGNNATAKTYVTGVGIFIYTAKVAIYTATYP